MAVLVRAGRTMIPGLTRALVAAGVPVEVAGDEIPLAADPAVRPLAAGSSGRRSRLRAHRRGGTAAAHLTARWHGQHVHSPSGTRPP